MADSVAKALAHIGQLKRLKKFKAERRAAKTAKRSGTKADVLLKLGTLDLVPVLFPKYERPTHLAPMVDVLEQSWVRPTRATCHAPPQHGKSDTASAFVVATLKRFPEKRIAYVTHSAKLARRKGGRMRKLARAAGVALIRDTTAKDEWETPEGGGLICIGIEQGLTGQPVDILLIDDPYPNRKKARSRAYQRMVIEFWGDVAETRVQPDGSIFVWHTRWLVNDLIGMLKAGKLSDGGSVRFQHIHLAAENDNGEPLWHRYPREVLATKRANVITWWSLYMGEPRAEGSQVFRAEVVTYDPHELDAKHGLVYAFGLDFAYTAKTSADASVIHEWAREGRGPKARMFIADRISVQVTAPVFVGKFAAKRLTRPHARARAYVGGVERGATEYLTASPPQGAGLKGVDIRNASADKLVRAMPFAESWNDGRVLVPQCRERDPNWHAKDSCCKRHAWVPVLVDILTSFTGEGGDEDDDDVDAGAAAHDELAANSNAGGGATDDEPDFGDRAAMLM